MFGGEKVPCHVHGFLVVCIWKAGGGWAGSSCEHEHPAMGGIHSALSVALDIGVKFSGRVLQFVL